MIVEIINSLSNIVIMLNELMILTVEHVQQSQFRRDMHLLSFCEGAQFVVEEGVKMSPSTMRVLEPTDYSLCTCERLLPQKCYPNHKSKHI